MIFLDHNSSTPVNEVALEFAVSRARDCFENPSAPYAKKAKEHMDWARQEVAQLMGCDFSSIIFTSGATESNNIALRTSPELGDVVICSEVEHSSVYGCAIEKVKVTQEGFLDLNHLEDTLKKWAPWKAKRTLAVMSANNETGIFLDPHHQVPELCRKYNVRLHVDAVQSVCKTDFSVKDCDADSISISGHKIGALKGIGALYLKPDHKISKYGCGGPHEFGVRPGTENQIGIQSLGYVASRFNVLTSDEKQEKWNQVAQNRDLLELLLTDIAETNGSKQFRLCNTTNLYFPSIPDADLLVDELFENGVAVSSRASCLSGMPVPSRVIEAMFGEGSDRANKSLRISLSFQTTEQDIREAADKIQKCVSKIKE